MQNLSLLTVALALATVGAFSPIISRTNLFGRRFALRNQGAATSESADYLSESSLDLTGGSILVSGFLDDAERDDQFIFDVLHAPRTWTQIIAFNADNASAKKRLISRSARYTGLLDVLQFQEGDRTDAAAMKSVLDGKDAWINFNADAKSLAAMADVAIAAGIKYVITSVVLSEDAKVPDFGPVASKLDSAGVAYAFVASGPVTDEEEELGLVRIENCTAGVALPEGGKIGRPDLVRVVGVLAGESSLSGAVVNAYAPLKGDNTTAAYLRGLREKGVTRAEELSAMMSGGLKTFEEAEAERIAEEIRNASLKAAEVVVPITDESRAEERIRLRMNNLREEQKEFQEEVQRRANKKLDLEWGNVKWKISMDERDYRQLNWGRACAMAMKEMYATLRWQGTLEEALDTPNVLELIGEIPPAIETYPDPDPMDDSEEEEEAVGKTA